MFRRLSFLVIPALLALAIAAPASAATSAAALSGIWRSIDTDGSSQMLIVSGGSSPSVVYQDFYASGCDRSGEPTTHWTAAGRGSVDGDILFVEFHKSGCGTFLQGGYSDWYAYDSGSDTLVDSFGIVWHRS